MIPDLLYLITRFADVNALAGMEALRVIAQRKTA